ncbi:invasion associated locus B family protein [Ruixingdingia sedimenti]|uniref:Invasion associated locus B family protein n=1 Tax=Ruixingdingia sedimenti TaxID=3073604 RepID=A0ABU1F597_9RHOB|nr:invasion associated locus B family protein [Xinfangfangia sp. LG-4]MDR5651818.1 invasion associated locus B family protein [Xinfangfangia sp. LG-4]
MTHRSLPLALVLCAALAPAAALAQSGGTPAETPAPTEQPQAAEPAPGAPSLGEPVADENAPGRLYVAETFDDWQMTCERTGLEADPCELFQGLNDPNGGPVAEISLFNMPKGGEAVMGGTIVTPLETLLTQAVTMRIDGGQAKRYPFTFCAPVGCVARVGFTQADLDAFRRGKAAEITIVPMVAPDQQVKLTMSLKGFTKGYDAVVAANTKAAEVIAKAAKEAQEAEAAKPAE